MDENNGKPAYDYATFPRQFVSYRWFKPLLVFALAFVFMLVFQIALLIVAAVWDGSFAFFLSLGAGYDNMNAYTGPGALFEIGGIAVMLPALALAVLIVRDRPYSSYSSSRGGWNWRLFAKCLAVALVVLGGSAIIDLLIPGHVEETIVNRFTVEGFILCAILIPIQCVAEEYVFRGFFLQAVSSWFKVPVIGIVVSAVVFAAGHPYNEIGVILIFCNGIVWGVIACLTKGLEATSAAHIVNNYIAFYLAGFGIQATTSEVDIASLFVALAVDAVYAIAIIVLGRKFGWFESQGDGVTAFNEKKLAKMAKKRARKQQAQLPAQEFTPMPVLVPGQVYAQAATQVAGQAYAQVPDQAPMQAGVQPFTQAPAQVVLQPPVQAFVLPPTQLQYAYAPSQQPRTPGYPEPPILR